MIDFNKPIEGVFDIDNMPEGAVTDSNLIEPLFEIAADSEFLDSLYDWWQEKGFLTELQFAKLEEIAERETGGRYD